MITAFRSKDTEKIFSREPVSQFSQGICRKTLRKLLVVDAAERLDDLRMPPGNQLGKPGQVQGSSGRGSKGA
jgi:proteic killer suppression protein